MSKRSVPRTIPEIVAYIEERLRRTQTDVVTVRVVTDHGGLTGLSDDDHPQYQLRSELGDADGYAGLDSGGTVPKTQLPGDVVYTADLPDITGVATLVWLTMAEV